MKNLALAIGFLMLQFHLWGSRQPFYDRVHQSKAFGEPRNYRIVLPPDYETHTNHYPAIYYLHGHSDRYTSEHYDNGKDFLPRMIDFVSKNGVIVILVDGYVAEHYQGFYGGSPWDLMQTGGNHDFGPYFEELVQHIDSSYRTLTDRRHRATSGLSMGGFMSLYLSARYPHLIGSASAFNPGPEFYTGGKGRRVLWRPKDHVSSHAHSMIRLIRASGDYISQYHEETRDAYARDENVEFEFRQDEYHRHWATSIEETFRFHMRAFANPALNNVPATWSHASAYRTFEAWGYKVVADGNEPGITYLQNVVQGGLRVLTRQWAPDGPPMRHQRITVTTAPRYQPGKSYTILDHNLASKVTTRSLATSDPEGRLRFTIDGGGHEISFVGSGTGAQPPVLLQITQRDRAWVYPGMGLHFPLRIYNPRGEPMTSVKVALSSEYPTVNIEASPVELPKIESGEFVDVAQRFRLRFTAGAGYFAPARLRITMTYDGWHEVSENIDVLVAPEIVAEPAAVEVFDGRSATLKVFRQAGNQGGGASIDRTVSEGKGNGNGIPEPDENVTLWVKMAQGMDPFDKNNWHRCRVYADSPWVEEVGLIEDEKQREWTGARERTSLIHISARVAPGTMIPILLENESWSFHYTPDARYGTEKLYQAFQLHSRHLHRYTLEIR